LESKQSEVNTKRQYFEIFENVFLFTKLNKREEEINQLNKRLEDLERQLREKDAEGSSRVGELENELRDLKRRLEE